MNPPVHLYKRLTLESTYASPNPAQAGRILFGYSECLFAFRSQEIKNRVSAPQTGRAVFVGTTFPPTPMRNRHTGG